AATFTAVSPTAEAAASVVAPAAIVVEPADNVEDAPAIVVFSDGLPTVLMVAFSPSTVSVSPTDSAGLFPTLTLVAPLAASPESGVFVACVPTDVTVCVSPSTTIGSPAATPEALATFTFVAPAAASRASVVAGPCAVPTPAISACSALAPVPTVT